MTAGIAAILATIREAAAPYSAGLAAGGGGVADGGADAALDRAAFFSTMRTEMIDPS